MKKRLAAGGELACAWSFATMFTRNSRPFTIGVSASGWRCGEREVT
jgi:hypothetical protein